MPWWEAILDSLAVVAVLLLFGFVFLFVRRRWLGRAGGAFECSVRTRIPKNVGGPRGWTLGLGRYTGDNLEWFRVFSFSPRPRHVFAAMRRSSAGGLRMVLRRSRCTRASVIDVDPTPHSSSWR